ncbi:FAD-dependent oxidoreductase [Streptomyces sp. NRRL S-813]|uniref:FAD-dependent oxidoreductase n=1 Tax=Streptomyces sp. NRRL S-813 TaxID=1463919 RepID=UPI0004BFDE5B|nr:FAD-dependent oxidoreductase [Streptomyces sp. NRRL S-813]
MLRVAVVGSGPSGCYTAQGLVQQDPSVCVDVLDRLPCPYGLVRYGVAPDHEKIKSLQNNLRAVLEHDRVRFLGGVQVGGPGGVPAGRLRELYHAVVYCVGAATDRHLGIPGEDLPGSWSATEFVSWYSAHPDAVDDGFVRGAHSAVVIGVGNVAVDVTRMLARGAAELSPTDVPEAALAALAASRVSEIHMVGRRGPSQARFTTKELRELGALPDTEVVVDPEELALDPGYADPSALPATQRRNVEVLREWAATPPRGAARRIRLRFFLRPVELLAADGRVAAVRFERTAPDGRGGVTGTGRYEDVAAQLVLRSVGYRGVPLEGLPFDADTGTVPHQEGRVLRDGAVAPGEYVAGWIKRGPTGVIGTNRPCAKETVTSLLADAPALVRAQVPEDAVEVLRAEGVEPVEWEGWQAIERAEAELGASLGRSVVKLPDWASLRAAARTSVPWGP